MDDALDYAADQAVLGKTVGDDFREGKITLPVLVAFQAGDAADRDFWRRTIEATEQNEADLDRALHLMERCGAIRATLDRAARFRRSREGGAGAVPRQRAAARAAGRGGLHGEPRAVATVMGSQRSTHHYGVTSDRCAPTSLGNGCSFSVFRWISDQPPGAVVHVIQIADEQERLVEVDLVDDVLFRPAIVARIDDIGVLALPETTHESGTHPSLRGRGRHPSAALPSRPRHRGHAARAGR